MIAQTNTHLEFNYLLLPADKLSQRCSDISLTKQTLDWALTVAIEVGLRHTVEYFESVVAAPQPTISTPRVDRAPDRAADN